MQDGNRWPAISCALQFCRTPIAIISSPRWEESLVVGMRKLWRCRLMWSRVWSRVVAALRGHSRLRSSALLILFVHLLLALAPCAAAESRRPNPLLDAESWGYQLQALDERSFAALHYDVLVLDHTKRGAPGSELTPQELARIARKPEGGRRLLLSYLSIGEAENYRYYWQGEWNDRRPDWIGEENKDWAGNFVVRFWHDEWQRIIFESPDSFLSRIIAAGFDGVYLDRVDVYSELENENPRARADMIAFVTALSARARMHKPGFLVVVQNAEELAASDRFLEAIDGIAKEDLLFGVDHKASRNPRPSINEALGYLRRARDHGKGVLVVEYLSQPDVIARTQRELGQLDPRFILHFADRPLSGMRAEVFEDLDHEDDDTPLPPGE
jgi:cysteinyl-tRNA synthetase, unknown class